MTSTRCSSSRWEKQNLLGMLWVIGIFSTIIFYHLWWVEGATMVGSTCKVEDTNVKKTTCYCETSNCPQKEWTCFYPIWWVTYRDHKFMAHNGMIKGKRCDNEPAAQEAMIQYKQGDEYACYYQARKTENVQWENAGTQFFYAFAFMFFLSSILPCFCYIIGIKYVAESMLKLCGSSATGESVNSSKDITIFSPFDGSETQRNLRYRAASRSIPRSRDPSEEEYEIQEDYHPLEDDCLEEIEPVVL